MKILVACEESQAVTIELNPAYVGLVEERVIYDE